MKKGSTVTKNGFYLHSYKPSAILECTIGWVGSGFKSASFFRETVHTDRVKIINPMYWSKLIFSDSRFLKLQNHKECRRATQWLLLTPSNLELIDYFLKWCVMNGIKCWKSGYFSDMKYFRFITLTRSANPFYWWSFDRL